MDQLLTVTDVQRILNCHRNTVYNLIKAKKLTATRIQATSDRRPRYRIAPEDLASYINGNKGVSEAEQARMKLFSA